MAERRFTRQEKLILKVLFENRRCMSLKEIAEEAHMSWVTSRKYVERLTKRGWVIKEKKKIRGCFIFNYSKLPVDDYDD